jgi:hypothetical protein
MDTVNAIQQWPDEQQVGSANHTAAVRARRYLAKLPLAVTGQGGHAGTFLAACRLVEFGLCWPEAWPILAEWNQSHCRPAWSEGDLHHKLADAYRHTKPRPGFAGSGVTADRGGGPFQSVRHGAGRPFDPVAAVTGRGRLVPLRLPPLRPGSVDDFARLAKLRGLSVDGLRLASSHGLLRFGIYRGQSAWFVTDRTNRIAQARRMDGAPWFGGAKAWTLPGSQAARPVGIEESRPFPVVALVEGGPDLLAAFDLILRCGRERDVVAVAVLGASMRLPVDAISEFAGKRVGIFPHSDIPGGDAGRRWGTQLREAGACVEAFDLGQATTSSPTPLSDLNELAAASELPPALLKSLFPQ